MDKPVDGAVPVQVALAVPDTVLEPAVAVAVISSYLVRVVDVYLPR